MVPIPNGLDGHYLTLDRGGGIILYDCHRPSECASSITDKGGGIEQTNFCRPHKNGDQLKGGWLASSVLAIHSI